MRKTLSMKRLYEFGKKFGAAYGLETKCTVFDFLDYVDAHKND